MRRQIINTIEVMLEGGLGNQLFQYYAGEETSHILGVDFDINLSMLPDQTEPISPSDRAFQLCDFENLPKKRIKYKSTAALRAKTAIKFPKLENLVGVMSDSYYLENSHDFSCDSNFARNFKSHRLILNGYFQTAKYIWQNHEIISNQLEKTSLSMAARVLVDKIEILHNPIGIHLRLGDYLRNKDFKVVSENYILSCLKEITNSCESSKVFVITDSEDMIFPMYSKLFLEHDVVILDTKKIRASELLQILKRFSYLILSKSSISWWGGFLAACSGGQVFAPFVREKATLGNFRQDQIIPTWKLIPN